jgi:hypothetical protein
MNINVIKKNTRSNIMKNINHEKQKMLQKWANLIFGLLTVSSLLISLAILWLNK